jgi:LacI family transcriptional regulator
LDQKVIYNSETLRESFRETIRRVRESMPITIRDLAKQLNMSVSTVSYALNNGPRPVPIDVREKVLNLAKELDYRPNRLAKSMVTGRTFTLGIVPSGQFDNFILSPFILSCVNGIVNECERRKYDVLLFTRFDSREEFEISNSISDGRADGLIFLAPISQSNLLEVAHRRGVPFIVTNSKSESHIPCYTVDNTSVVNLAIQHFTELGHQKIGHIYGSQDLQDGFERKEIFDQFLLEKRFVCHPSWIGAGHFTQEGGKEVALEMLSQIERPTAIFCSNDEMALGAIWAARELGLSVPEDVSIIGVDNAPWSQLITPALTTIEQPAYEIAVAAVNALLAQIEQDVLPVSQQFRPELVVRDSTCSPKEHK